MPVSASLSAIFGGISGSAVVPQEEPNRIFDRILNRIVFLALVEDFESF